MPGDYINSNTDYPLPSLNIPGISLPSDFAIESADRSLVGSVVEAPTPATKESAVPSGPIRFPTRNTNDYGEAIARLIGSFSGPGFNLIFRPHADKAPDELAKKPPPKDDLLELNLTHELWTFPTTKGNLGPIPNRVAGATVPGNKDVILQGIPYTQIVREVTTTSGDSAEVRIPVDRLGVPKPPKTEDPKKPLPVGPTKTREPKKVQDIHFEAGLLIQVPASRGTLNKETICRMASIPHGTAINAQGGKAIKFEGSDIKPEIPVSRITSKRASQPFDLASATPVAFKSEFDINSVDATRLPQDLRMFIKRPKMESITQALIDDPNNLLNWHNEGKTFSQVIVFKVTTAPVQDPVVAQACPHLAAKKAMEDAVDSIRAVTGAPVAGQIEKSTLKNLQNSSATLTAAIQILNPPTAANNNGGPAKTPAIGTANIAFLDGAGDQQANASTGKVESTFWISTVVYTIEVPSKWDPEFVDNDPKKGVKLGVDKKPIKKLIVDPINTQSFDPGTVPQFIFPADKPVEAGKYKVEATQVQYSQNVLLNFNTLSWPHISVATVVPVRPILINNAVRLS
jgi:hypothetical protein